MQRFTLSVCSRCRQSRSRPVYPQIWFKEAQYLPRRFRSSKTAKPKFEKRPSRGFDDGKALIHAPWQSRPQKSVVQAEVEWITAEEVPTFLALRVDHWAKIPSMRRRLHTFGIPLEDIPILLAAFVKKVKGGLLTRPGIRQKYALDRFTGSHVGSQHERLDQALTNVFYAWASDPDHQAFLQTIIPQSTLEEIILLRSVADRSYPFDSFPKARAMRRKFHMHVGPTNSGKTHVALRALAAANSGVYAGPLRLLAHEVWERLNKGQIVPSGVDSDADAETAFDTVGEESSGRPTVRKQDNPNYARECNLRTGEELKVVSEGAGLLSCTIEMLTTINMYDVAVLDEIQMIGDPERGGAWTKAVLGIHAKEIHLCGEETAIPIIEALVKETGDELVINRYERLTPLVVQEQSLEGDLTRIQKGDCIVSFSRSGIFALKRQVEELTGMRCAVAYGRLPPEIRSEQAALFNDPESGYDVMIGSDAIGMGLNLKIKRVVFQAVHKFSGTHDICLSDSQLKQIAGRAGRYGLHGDGTPGGFTTTLHPQDLPILRKAIASPIKPLSHAYINLVDWNTADVVDRLPIRSPLLTIFETYHYVTRMRWPYELELTNSVRKACDFIETIAGEATLADKILMMTSPATWRDPDIVEIITQFYRQYLNHMQVNLIKCLRHGPLDQLEDVEADMSHGPPHSSQQTLRTLETLHKALVFYLWMYMRSPVSWGDYLDATNLKERTERALDWSLQGLSRSSQTRQLPDVVTLRQRQEANKITYLNRQHFTDSKRGKIKRGT